MFGVEWAVENAPTANGIHCNGSIILASVGARIPNSGNPAQPTVIDPKLYFPKEALAKWGSKYLTSSHVTYKGGDRVLISKPSKMKIGKYYDYLPKEVHDTTKAIAEKFVVDNLDKYPNLTRGHIVIRWITMRCNLALDIYAWLRHQRIGVGNNDPSQRV